jgi:hypothetical protein
MVVFSGHILGKWSGRGRVTDRLELLQQRLGHFGCASKWCGDAIVGFSGCVRGRIAVVRLS